MRKKKIREKINTTNALTSNDTYQLMKTLAWDKTNYRWK